MECFEGFTGGQAVANVVTGNGTSTARCSDYFNSADSTGLFIVTS